MFENWTREWPNEKGLFWFWGYRYGKISCGRKCEKEMQLCDNRKISNGFILKDGNGQFMYKSEVEDAYFMKAILPEPPRDI